MPNCIVLGCPHRCGNKGQFPEVILHSFPRSLDQIKAWLYQTGQIYEDLDEMAQRIYERKKTNAYRLCSAHFTKDSYIINQYKKILRPDALPSIFPSPGAYYDRKRPRKRRKRNKDSSQVSNPPTPMEWKETWTNREILFGGEDTQTNVSCFDTTYVRWYNKSVSDRDHARVGVHPRPHPHLKEELLEVPCAGQENVDVPHPGLLTSIKSENIDEQPEDHEDDGILRILVDSPKNEDNHLMSPGIKDETNVRATEHSLHEAEEMPKCIVQGCPHFAGRKNSTPGVTLHMFPKDLNVIKKWLLQTNQDFGDLDLFAEGILQGKIGISRICSAHFAPECYALVGSQKILLDGSIPTIFPERDKASNENAANPAFQNIYLPLGLWTNNMSVVPNVASWGVNQFIGPDVNQDIVIATNGLGVNVSTSAIEHNMEIIPNQYGNPPTTNFVGKSPPPRTGNVKARAKKPKAKPQKQRKTVNETGLVVHDVTTNKVNKAIQWPEYENNVSGELWKVMHDHFYKVPRKYKEMKKCSVMSEYGVRKYLHGNDTESELFSTLQYVANVFSMNKSRELKSTRMLNQALEIVSLIAGEEWVIVKKNSIHNGVHELTGEVPIKCGEVAVYFSMDEWDYIEDHKEDYEDFVTDNIPLNRTWEVPEQWDSDPMTEYEEFEELEEDEEEDIPDPPPNEDSSDWEPDSDMEFEKKEKSVAIRERVISSNPETEEPQMTHKCDECEEAFPDEEALEAHKPTHIRKCEDCEELFSTEAKLIKHRAENHATKRFACTICGIQYDYKSQFIIHQRAHTGEKPFPCAVCGKKFGHRSSLLVHQRRHTAGKTFECGKCDRRFDKKSELVRHEKDHSQNQPYKCKKCEKTFACKTGLLRHRKDHPEENDDKKEKVRSKKHPFKCKVCGKKFAQKRTYEKHMWEHDDY